MGHLYALCGCSGVGKTTFLKRLFETNPSKLRLILRTTGRHKRLGEKEGFDYHFLSREGFLQKIFANDLIHVEQYGGDYFGIETRYIESAIRSDSDGIIMAGIYGATKLKAVFGQNVSIVYMYTGTRDSLLDPICLHPEASEIVELRRRLLEKVDKGLLSPEDKSPKGIEVFIRERMELNYLDLAFINGRIRSGEQVDVLENIRDHLDDTIEQFFKLRLQTSGLGPYPYVKTNSCFVLMPFKVEMKPVYEDHISPAIRSLGLDCLRADQIFSTKPVMDDILEAVRNSRIVVADLTYHNPNVFYETGICHALGKDVILITQDEAVPFDLRHIRHILYEYTPRGMKKFEKALKETIKSILAT